MRARETSGNRLRPRPQSAPDTRLARVSENNHSHSRSWLRASNIPASEGVGHGKDLWPFHPKVEGHAEGVRQAVRRGEPSVLALWPAGQLRGRVPAPGLVHRGPHVPGGEQPGASGGPRQPSPQPRELQLGAGHKEAANEAERTNEGLVTVAQASIHYAMSDNEFLSVEITGPAKSPDQLFDLKSRATDLFREALALADEAEVLAGDTFGAKVATELSSTRWSRRLTQRRNSGERLRGDRAVHSGRDRARPTGPRRVGWPDRRDPPARPEHRRADLRQARHRIDPVVPEVLP